MIELNEILLKACLPNPRQRYQSAPEMHADLLLLASGKSIRRLRILERQLALAKKVGIATAAAALLAAGGLYTARRGERAANEMLVRLSVDQGTRLMQDGDLFGSLLWSAEALRLDMGGAKREEIHRLRIGALFKRAPKLRQIWFHNQAVNFVEFGKNGRWIATASEDRTARVWDVDSGEAVTPVLHHSHGVLHATFSPDSAKLLTCCRDGTAQIWCLPGGEPASPPLRHPYRVWNGSFSPDGRCVLTVCSTTAELPEGEATVWSGTTGERLNTILQPPVRNAAFSPDSRRVLTLHGDATARIWDLTTGAPLTPPMLHAASAILGAFSADGNRIVTVCRAPAGARVWNAETGTPITPELRHEANVTWASFSPDGKLVVSCSKDGTARVWDAATGQIILPPLPHGETGSISRFASH